MPTLKLYLSSSDLIGSALITAIRENNVIRLDRTLFHAKGGGQKADQGTIGGITVTGVMHAEQGEVDHFLSHPARFEVGSSVEICIDAVARRRNSRLHSAGHLIADMTHKLEPGLRAVQGHHWDGEARVEFEGLVSDETSLAERLQASLDVAISKGLEFDLIGDPFSSRAVQIKGFDPVGCGGTHVTDASELKGLKVESIKMKKGRMRVSYAF